MKFAPAHRCFDFEIPDDWWVEGEMLGFRPSTGAFAWHPAKEPWLAGFPVEVLAIDRIRRGKRTRADGDFDKTRMINILRGIARGEQLPPITVCALKGSKRFTHRLYDGFHRYCASIAAGYESISAITIEDPRA